MYESPTRGKGLENIHRRYRPTIFSVPLPESAQVFSLSTDVFDLFSMEEIAAYIKKVGNADKAIRRLDAVAKDPKKTPLEKVKFIRGASK